MSIGTMSPRARLVLDHVHRRARDAVLGREHGRGLGKLRRERLAVAAPGARATVAGTGHLTVAGRSRRRGGGAPGRVELNENGRMLRERFVPARRRGHDHGVGRRARALVSARGERGREKEDGAQHGRYSSTAMSATVRILFNGRFRLS
jgi:hypothetical protein